MNQRVTLTGFACVMVLVGILVSPSEAWAGWGYPFRDLQAASPSGRYRLDATRCENPEKDNADRAWPFYFAYRLHDTRSGAILWQRDQRPDEASPTAVFVADDAWTVVWLHLGHGHLEIVRPDGTPAAKFAILADLLTAEEREKRVVHTSAGADLGYRYCYTIVDRATSYFVMRTFWDRRVLIDLRQGRVIPASETIAATLNRQEQEHVMSTLRRAAETDSLEEIDYGQHHSLTMAIHIAGRLRVQESIPLLRTIESKRCGTRSFRADEFTDANESFAYSWRDHELRREAQTALRRLGQKPGRSPAMTLADVPTYQGIPWLKTPSAPREQQVDQVRPGMTPRQVLEILGLPDNVPISGQWRYDIDAESPFTLILLWQEGRLGRVVSEVPPVWKTKDACEGDSSRPWLYRQDTADTGS